MLNAKKVWHILVWDATYGEGVHWVKCPLSNLFKRHGCRVLYTLNGVCKQSLYIHEIYNLRDRRILAAPSMCIVANTPKSTYHDVVEEQPLP